MPRNRGIPHYRRIADALLATLQDRKDLQLPSERALAKRYKIARNTAGRVLNELKAQGYVHRLQGSGTYSCDKSTRLVFAFSYYVGGPGFSQLYRWLGYFLGKAGLRLVTCETGLYGERYAENADFIAQARHAEAIVWCVSSHPVGVRASVQVRRHLPPRLPLILMGDPLGLALQGKHRFDLLHHDYSYAMQKLLALLSGKGSHHPILISRQDIKTYSTEETVSAFLASLIKMGIHDAGDHIFDWDPSRSRSLQRLFNQKRKWKPSAIILQYSYEDEFRERCREESVKLLPNIPLIAFGQDKPSMRLALNYRSLAEVCSDLVLSRLQRPTRPNLHVAVNLPVQGRPKSKEL